VNYKKVLVDYYDHKKEIMVPEDSVIVESSPPDGAEDPQQIVKDALANPLGMPRIYDSIKPGYKVTIAMDDCTRPARPRQVMLPIIIEELNKAGVPDADITLLLGNGNHQKFTQEQIRQYVGDEIFRRFWPKGTANSIINHDCADPDNLVFMGVSEMGDYVEYNKLLYESDFFIYLGSVLPSNWGGMTGCGVIIGLAGARSMRSTHGWDVVGDKDSCHADQHKMLYRKHKDAIMDQIEKFCGKKVFYVDSILGKDKEIVAAFAGHYKEIQKPAWELVEKYYRVEVPQADIVVIGLPRNFMYGSSDNPMMPFVGTCTAPRHWVNKPLVREGGVVIGVCRSSGEISERDHPNHKQALEYWKRCFDASEMLNYEDEWNNHPEFIFKYRHCYGYHPVHASWLFYESQYMLDHCSKIIMAGEINPGPYRALGVTPVRDFEKAMIKAKQIVGENPKVVVLPSFWTKPRMQLYVK